MDDSNKRPDKTVLCVLPKDGDKEFTEGQLKSLNKVVEMVKNNGGKGIITHSIETIVHLL